MRKNSLGQDIYDFSNIAVDSFEWLLSDASMKSGVGLVTQDGMWGDQYDEKYKNEDIKILGFTDQNYIAIAKVWYNRLTILV